MSIFPTSAPILGLDGNGNPVNMIVKSDGSTSVSGTIESNSLANTASEEAIVEVTAITLDGSKIVATGYSVDGQKNTSSIAWIYDGGWATGSAPSTTLRSVGLSSKGGKTLISSGEFIYNTTFTNLNGKLENSTTKITSLVDCLAVGSSLTVGSSLSEVGVWTNAVGSPEWTHVSLGVEAKTFTGHYSTSFTFPGYSGADPQIQRINAHPSGDIPPSSWDVYDAKAKGYYGVLEPSVTVKWIPPV